MAKQTSGRSGELLYQFKELLPTHEEGTERRGQEHIIAPQEETVEGRVIPHHVPRHDTGKEVPQNYVAQNTFQSVPSSLYCKPTSGRTRKGAQTETRPSLQ